MRVVINGDYGGFGLSRKAFHRLRELGHPLALEEADLGEPWKNRPTEVRESMSGLDVFCHDIDRTDPLLLQVIDEIGEAEASSPLATLRVVEVPDDVEWEIDDYDGVETIHEVHRSWS